MTATQEEANQLRQALHNVQAQLAQVQLQQAEATTAGSPADDGQLHNVVDMWLLSRLHSFTKEDAEWRQWSFVFESMTGLVHLNTRMQLCVTEPEANLDISIHTPRHP